MLDKRHTGILLKTISALSLICAALIVFKDGELTKFTQVAMLVCISWFTWVARPVGKGD